MTPQQLRNSILQMAIEGKLVEQRPEEGTGKELYQVIQEEKLHFSKQQKFKSKEVINTNIEDECLSEIPSSWKWVRLGDVFDVVMGQSVSKDSISRTNQGIEFHQGKINFGNKVLKKSSMATNKPLKIASEGAVLLCVRAPVGKVNITDRCICIGRGLSAILPYGFISSEFLYFWLMAHENIFIKKSTGTTFKAITKEIVKNLLIPLPPLREQKRILEKIEAIFLIIDRYENAWQKLNELNKKFPEELQKSILQEAIQGKLCKQRAEEGSGQVLIEKILLEKERLIESGQIKKQKALPPIQEDERPFDIPDSWCWARLNNIVYNRGQKRPDTEFSYIDIGSIDNINQKLTHLKKYTNIEDIPSRARRIVDLGDILYSTVRPYLHNMCIVDRVDPCETIASTGFAAMTCHQGILNKYLFYYLLSPSFDKYANSAENSKGVAYPAINDKQLYKAVVPIPSLNEQKRIAMKIEEVFEKIASYRLLLLKDNI